MSASMQITNRGGAQIVTGGAQIAPGVTQSFNTAQIAGVCSDLEFLAAYVGGILDVKLNGHSVPDNSPAAMFMFVAIAIGDVVPA